MSLEMCRLLFISVDVDLKKIFSEYFAMGSAVFSCVDGPTMQMVT